MEIYNQTISNVCSTCQAVHKCKKYRTIMDKLHKITEDAFEVGIDLEVIPIFIACEKYYQIGEDMYD